MTPDLSHIARSGAFDVIVVGGGATGAGVARDCAMRGLRTLLLEQDDYATGATGRNHGLLHSGGRYAVSDLDNAAECITENRILRRIANHCVEPTEGLFVCLPDDEMAYLHSLVEACRSVGINADVLTRDEVLRLEPALNPGIIGAVTVPDAVINPFALTHANLLDARRRGAVTLARVNAARLIVEADRVAGVEAVDLSNGTTATLHARVVINAAGIWGRRLLSTAGITLSMLPAKGSMLVMSERPCRRVVNRCRQPGNGDIIVPDGTVAILGTTSVRVGFDQIANPRVTDEERRLLIEEGQKLIPSLATMPILRAYAGVRPLVADDSDPTGRTVSRGIVCLDHAERDGMEGLVTITGGKLITYRLMAQRATDLACRKLGSDAACTTASTPLPGSEQPAFIAPRPHTPQRRHGTLAAEMSNDDGDRTVVCECEGVTLGELRYAINTLGARTLDDLRRRTRLGMGQCQCRQCACRAVGIIAALLESPEKAKEDIAEFLAERWKGVEDTGRENALPQAQRMNDTLYQLGVPHLAWQSRKEDTP